MITGSEQPATRYWGLNALIAILLIGMIPFKSFLKSIQILVSQISPLQVCFFLVSKWRIVPSFWKENFSLEEERNLSYFTTREKYKRVIRSESNFVGHWFMTTKKVTLLWLYWDIDTLYKCISSTRYNLRIISLGKKFRTRERKKNK